MPKKYRPRVVRVCQQCSKTFTVKASHLNFHPALFCSPRCLGDSRKAGERIEKDRATRAEARAFVAGIRARTHCAHCGAQPIDWHNPDHVALNRQNYRISRMVGTARAVESIQAEIDRCTPLCRRCHMIEDGRLKALIAPHAALGALLPVDCTECSKPTMRPRKGLCVACNSRRLYWARKQAEA